MKGLCNIETYKMVYYGVIQSHLSYGIIFQGSCADTKLSRAFVLQKSAIRIICNLSSTTSCEDYFKVLNIFTIPSSYIFETIIYCVSKCNLIQGQDDHSYNPRSNTTYRQDIHRLKIYERLPMHAGIKFLNRLPTNIKSLLGLHNSTLFKNKLKQYMLVNAFYSVSEFMEYTSSVYDI